MWAKIDEDLLQEPLWNGSGFARPWRRCQKGESGQRCSSGVVGVPHPEVVGVVGEEALAVGGEGGDRPPRVAATARAALLPPASALPIPCDESGS